MKQETLFRQRLMPILKKIPHSHWFSIQQTSICGTPDILGVVNGYFVALEIKVDATSKRSELQYYNILRVQASGGYAEFIYKTNMDRVISDLLKLATGKRMDELGRYLVKLFSYKAGHRQLDRRRKSHRPAP